MDQSFLNNILKGYDRWHNFIVEIVHKIIEIIGDIYNMPNNTGICMILSFILSLITIIIYIFRKKGSEKIRLISLIIALLAFIPSSYFGYSFYNESLFREYNLYISRSTTVFWFGFQGFILSLLFCQVIMGFIDWLRHPAE